MKKLHHVLLISFLFLITSNSFSQISYKYDGTLTEYEKECFEKLKDYIPNWITTCKSHYAFDQPNNHTVVKIISKDKLNGCRFECLLTDSSLLNYNQFYKNDDGQLKLPLGAFQKFSCLLNSIRYSYINLLTHEGLSQRLSNFIDKYIQYIDFRIYNTKGDFVSIYFYFNHFEIVLSTLKTPIFSCYVYKDPYGRELMWGDETAYQITLFKTFNKEQSEYLQEFLFNTFLKNTYNIKKSNIRSDDTIHANIISQLDSNNSVELIALHGNWYKIKFSNKANIGWIHNSCLAIQKATNIEFNVQQPEKYKKPSNYFPLSLNNKWTYNYLGNKIIEKNVVDYSLDKRVSYIKKIIKTNTDEILKSTVEAYSFKGKGIDLAGTSSDTNQSNIDWKFSHDKILEYPLSIKNEWTEYSNLAKGIEKKNEVICFSECNVKAGNFSNVCRIKFIIDSWREKKKVIGYDYYAYGVGLIKQEIENNEGKIKTILELISYSVKETESNE